VGEVTMSSFEEDVKEVMSSTKVSDFLIRVKTNVKENLEDLANSIAKIVNGEIAEINEGQAIVKTKNAPQADIATRIAKTISYCIYIRPLEEGLEIEEFECPPCEEGAFSKLPEKYFLVGKDRIVEKRGNDTYLVYVCKFKK